MKEIKMPVTGLFEPESERHDPCIINMENDDVLLRKATLIERLSTHNGFTKDELVDVIRGMLKYTRKLVNLINKDNK